MFHRRFDAHKASARLFWLVVNTLFVGTALKFFGDWFVAPVFFMNRIELSTALGLVLIVRLLLGFEEDDRLVTFQNLVEEAFRPALLLGLGFLIHRFMGM
jgi:hypothetical protein